MTDAPDTELLERFARDNSEPAFAVLVERHLGLVHSVALRHTANPQHAQDITQAVFIILAKKANRLSRHTVLPGWLYHTARLTAANFQRAETRRIRREQEAYMQSTIQENIPDALWTQMSPLLDEAMSHLGTGDRDALVLRYFQNKSLPEVGAAMGLAERAAQKRVLRAIEKLRKFFAKRGVTPTAATIAETISTHSVQVAPVALAKTISAVAMAKGAAATTSTLTLVKGALKIMAWTKMKTAVATGVALLLVSTATTVITIEMIHSEPSYGGKTITQWLDQFILYQNQQNGTVTALRLETPMNDPAMRALLAIGPRAVPTLEKRLIDPPEQPPSSKKPKGRFIPNTYPEFQRARKTAAAFTLIALGKNEGGGISTFLDTYIKAPRLNVTGPSVGVSPAEVAEIAKAAFPERHDEFVEDIFKGLENPNPGYRLAAMECARAFPDELLKRKDFFIQLTQDKDELVQETALGELMMIVQDDSTRALMSPSEIKRVAEDVLQNPQTTTRTRGIAETVRKLATERATK